MGSLIKNRKALAITLLITAAVCVASYFTVDIPLARFFEYGNISFKTVMEVVAAVIDPKNQYVVWPTLFLLLRFVWKQEIWANQCLLIAISFPVANLLVEILKCLLGRTRPELLFLHNEYGFTMFTFTDAFKSFPSGHASTIGAICGVFACFYPRKAAALFILALALAFSRVVLTSHYLSDIIAGVVIGFLISQWIYSMMASQQIRFKRG